eukprot:TRINITY_DN5719_c0_g1_i9.p1 TRINITY_DN5719_c0_g1~~TRINITY_DN5719_c0_g1_i9.p1  ORF type:complete len:244 (+),score=86.92 TRINITY_DN5719_c0_g1_i9:180-911(+)
MTLREQAKARSKLREQDIAASSLLLTAAEQRHAQQRDKLNKVERGLAQVQQLVSSARTAVQQAPGLNADAAAALARLSLQHVNTGEVREKLGSELGVVAGSREGVVASEKKIKPELVAAQAAAAEVEASKAQLSRDLGTAGQQAGAAEKLVAAEGLKYQRLAANVTRSEQALTQASGLEASLARSNKLVSTELAAARLRTSSIAVRSERAAERVDRVKSELLTATKGEGEAEATKGETEAGLP